MLFEYEMLDNVMWKANFVANAFLSTSFLKKGVLFENQKLVIVS